MYNCFQTVNDFAEALEDKTPCGEHAPKAMRSPYAHLGMGVAWYLSKNMDCIAEQKPLLVRSENFAADLAEAGKWLALANPKMHISFDKQSYPMKSNTHLSDKGKRLLMK